MQIILLNPIKTVIKKTTATATEKIINQQPKVSYLLQTIITSTATTTTSTSLQYNVVVHS